MQKEISAFSPEFKKILQSPEKTAGIKQYFADIHPHDIFIACVKLDLPEIAEIIIALGRPKGIELFEEFDTEQRIEIFPHFSKTWMTGLLEEMSSDERADFIKALPQGKTEEILPLVARAERNDIKKLIQYEEGTAGSILTTDYAYLPPEITAKEALERLKHQAFDRETIYYVYVTDEQRKLLGFVSLKNILLASSENLINNIMNKRVISVNAAEDTESVSKKLADYDFLAIPVVDNENKLLGIVTIDDVVDVVREEDTEDIYRYGAAGEHIDYIKSTPLSIAQQRIFWLLFLILVGFISGWIMEQHAARIQSMVAIVFFIPVLLAAGGNAGTQSSTVIIRGLATNEIKMKDILKIFKKELFTGLLMGIMMGILAAIRALIMNKNILLGFAVGLAMIITVMLATILGALLPLLFKRMKLDPALMSGPFIASILDVVAIFIYLRIATFIFRL
ncbi:MAG: magnesium transporter [Candidatus Omnitrophota bacterium]